MRVNNLFSTNGHKSSDLPKSKLRSEGMKLAGQNTQYSSDLEPMGSSRHSSNSQLSSELAFNMTHKAASGTALSTDSEESNTTSDSYHSLPNSIPSTPTKRVQSLSTTTEVGAPADQHLLVPYSDKETKVSFTS